MVLCRSQPPTACRPCLPHWMGRWQWLFTTSLLVGPGSSLASACCRGCVYSDVLIESCQTRLKSDLIHRPLSATCVGRRDALRANISVRIEGRPGSRREPPHRSPFRSMNTTGSSCPASRRHLMYVHRHPAMHSRSSVDGKSCPALRGRRWARRDSSRGRRARDKPCGRMCPRLMW
jgi:hypothetical protein